MSDFHQKINNINSRYQTVVEEEPESRRNRPARRDKAAISSRGNNIAETVLTVLAYIVLVVGIIVSLVIGIGALVTDGDSGKGWLFMFGGILLTLVMWASIMITVNISVNLRQIKQYLRDRDED